MPTCSLSAALPAIAARSCICRTFSPVGRPRGDGGVATPTSGFWVNAVQCAGNMRGTFYLGWILVYPNKSYVLFIQPHQQQVPGGGGEWEWYCKFFDLYCFQFATFTQRRFYSILGNACRNIKRPSPQRRIRWHTSPGEGKQVRFFGLSFIFRFALLQYHFVLRYSTCRVQYGEGLHVSSYKLSFLFPNCWHSLTFVLFLIFPQTR